MIRGTRATVRQAIRAGRGKGPTPGALPGAARLPGLVAACKAEDEQAGSAEQQARWLGHGRAAAAKATTAGPARGGPSSGYSTDVADTCLARCAGLPRSAPRSAAESAAAAAEGAKATAIRPAAAGARKRS